MESRSFAQKAKIPPTAVAGWFKSLLPESAHKNSGIPHTAVWGIVQVSTTLRETLAKYQPKNINRTDLNNPCTAVQGIHRSRSYVCCRKHLNHPPTAVGGIFAFCAKSRVGLIIVNTGQYWFDINHRCAVDYFNWTNSQTITRDSPDGNAMETDGIRSIW